TGNRNRRYCEGNHFETPSDHNTETTSDCNTIKHCSVRYLGLDLFLDRIRMMMVARSKD
ncbi:8091_t:CDS:1, partial [Gigaspora margarita]